MATSESGPPVPVLPLQNGTDMSLPKQDDKANSDDEVQRRTSSSVSRTHPQSKMTPPTERDKMDTLCQKIDFSESSPPRTLSWTTPHYPSAKPHPSLNGGQVLSAPPSLSGRKSTEKASPSSNNEQEIDSSVSVSAILSRLDTVRQYIDDAEQLYEQLQERSHEADVQEQLERVGGLVHQLKQQELSYLQVLLRIMEDTSSDTDPVVTMETGLESDQEESEDEDEDDPSLTGGNESLSLRAELQKEQETDDEFEKEEQEREILALQEQHALLKKLLEQQKQLEVLQAKQAHILSLKKDAEARLALVQKEREDLDYAVESIQSPDTSQQSISEHERELLSQLQEMRNKKAQVEQVLSEVQAIKVSPNKSLTTPTVPSQVTSNNNNKEELVSEEQATELNELRSKVKQIEDARQKLQDLQNIIASIQDNSRPYPSLSQSAPQLSIDDDNKKGGVNVTKASSVPVKKVKPKMTFSAKPDKQDPETEDTTEEGMLAILAEYESNIDQRQKELQVLRAQKEEIKQVESMLANLQLLTSEVSHEVAQTEAPQSSATEDEPVLQAKLELELQRQKELYSTLLRKTSQLQQLQQDIERLSRGSDQESGMVNTTAATWGGSTHVSEGDDETTGELDVTHDSLEQSTATIENEGYPTGRPAVFDYRVDRHTPRNPRPLRRAFSPHDDQETTEEKKIKLEPLSGPSSVHGQYPSVHSRGGATARSTTSRSAIWPAVIFPQHKKTQSEATPTVANPPDPPVKPTPVVPVPSEYVPLLQHQLGQSTGMCTQLLQQQTLLLSALHTRLDALPFIHDQLVQLQQYHVYLQGYNDYLNNAYYQLTQFQKSLHAKGPIDEEDPSPLANHNNSTLLEPIEPPQPLPILTPYSLGQINSPYQRPVNPHLLATPLLDESFMRPPSQQGTRTTKDKDEVTRLSDVHLPIKPTTGIQSGEAGSMSSLPMSFTDKPNPPQDNTVFEGMRDTIYTEVASLIANNEDRPHFLVELFRELQLLSTDYLKQRALYAIQDLVTRFITERDIQQDETSLRELKKWELGQTLSENDMTSGDDKNVTKDEATKRGNSARFDYVEPVQSASSLSTPPINDEPFANTLGDTVIKVTESPERGDVEPLKGVISGGESSVTSELDTSVLDEEIKSIMTDLIPLLKDHLMEECTTDLLEHIQQCVLSLVLLKEDTQETGELGDLFTKQLEVSLATAVLKFQGKILHEVGEDLLVDISEVLFNELAYYQLLKDQGGPPVNWPQSVASPQRPLDPVMLKALSNVMSCTLADEVEALGKTRDDELAKSWQPPKKCEEGVGQLDNDTSTVNEILTNGLAHSSEEEVKEKMQEEQKAIGGVVGLLATMESGPELAGCEDALPQPESSN